MRELGRAGAGLVLATLGLQLAFVHSSLMNAVFYSAPLERSDWLISVLVAAAVLPVVTPQKHATKKAAAHGAGVTPPS